jgi:ACS family tartrate transporter-like MFS transporter
MLCFTASGYAYMLNGPSIIQETTHLDATHVGFTLALFKLFGAAAMLLNAMHSDRTGERYWHVIFVCLVMAASLIFCGSSRAPQIVIPACGALIIANSAMQGPLWSLPATFLHGRSAAAGIAAINTISIFGGFLGPYWKGLARDLTGNYQRGLLTMAIPMLAATGIMLYLRWPSLPLHPWYRSVRGMNHVAQGYCGGRDSIPYLERLGRTNVERELITSMQQVYAGYLNVSCER